MAYEMVMPYQLHMPSYFLETFTEYPYLGTKDGNQAFTDSGTVVTIIGIPNDSTAIVYQLISATPGHEKTNFLAEGDSALTMIGKDFKKAVSKLNYTLKKKL